MSRLFPTATVEVAFDDPPTAAYADMTLAFNPMCYLRLNETVGTTAVDASGSGNNGIYVSAPGLTVAGALSGDTDVGMVIATGSTVSIPGLAAGTWAITDGNYSLEMWVKMVRTGVGESLFYSGTTSGASVPAAYLAITAAGYVEFIRTTGVASTVAVISSVPISDLTTWHHIVYVAAGSKLYLDGVLVGTGGVDGPAPAGGAGAQAKLGNYLSSFSQVYMDEFAAYDYNLTESQIMAHANAGATHASPTYTDVSSYLMGGSQKRGRSHELDQIQAGEATIRLKNTDRRFDPTYAAGPYYGKLLPLRRVRLKWTVDAVTYTRFVGFIERFPQYRDGPNMGYVDLTLVDGFEQLAQTDISDRVWAAETADVRIGRVLDACLWPTSLRNLDAGTATIPASTFTAGQFQSALSHIQEVADGDLGYFFVSHDGKATFHNRGHRGAHLTATASFGDASTGHLPYTGLTPDFYSKDHIFNDVSVTSSAAVPVPQRAQDGSSISRFFRRSIAKTVLSDSDADALAQAQVILLTHREPGLWIQAMELTPASSAAWAEVLGAEIGDRVTVTGVPAGGGPEFSIDCYIEAMGDQFERALQWRSVWQLSPASASIPPWILGDASWSQLDSTTILG